MYYDVSEQIPVILSIANEKTRETEVPDSFPVRASASRRTHVVAVEMPAHWPIYTLLRPGWATMADAAEMAMRALIEQMEAR
jgi:hypothetical protein